MFCISFTIICKQESRIGNSCTTLWNEICIIYSTSILSINYACQSCKEHTDILLSIPPWWLGGTLSQMGWRKSPCSACPIRVIFISCLILRAFLVSTLPSSPHQHMGWVTCRIRQAPWLSQSVGQSLPFAATAAWLHWIFLSAPVK